MAKKILVADDEQIIRESVELSLKTEGYEIHLAENGNQTVEIARRIRPHLVLLDIMMPDKWGFVVCEELKKDPDLKETVIVFLTGRAGYPSRKVGEMKGADGYIVKPFTPQSLREQVRLFLEK